MIGLLCFVLAALASAFKSKIRLEAENAALRHQLIVLRRKQRGRVKLANSDRWFFIQLYRWCPLNRPVNVAGLLPREPKSQCNDPRSTSRHGWKDAIGGAGTRCRETAGCPQGSIDHRFA